MGDHRDDGPPAGWVVDASGVIKPEGEIDLSNADRLRSALAAMPAEGEVVVDLSEVTFLDSTALNALVAGHLVRKRSGGSILLLNPRPFVDRVIELAGLDDIMIIRRGRGSEPPQLDHS
jgi:stage II sporulation protein AA (anti-sigma F factor antagonist)